MGPVRAIHLEEAAALPGAVVEVKRPIPEPALIEEFELYLDVSGETRFASTDHDWEHEEVDLIHKSCCEGVLCQTWPVDADVSIGSKFQSFQGFGVEAALESRARCPNRVEGAGVDDLVEGTPCLAVVDLGGVNLGALATVCQTAMVSYIRRP